MRDDVLDTFEISRETYRKPGRLTLGPMPNHQCIYLNPLVLVENLNAHLGIHTGSLEGQNIHSCQADITRGSDESLPAVLDFDSGLQ